MIGLFDSGVGATSVWREVVKILPKEDTILLADSKNAPYGVKSKEEIVALCEKNTEFLIKNDCDIIIVACNTATTNAISHLRSKYKIPFVGIEPAIKPASIHSKTKKVGILATQGTLSSELFNKTSQRVVKENHIQIIEQIGHGLVELIEKGQQNSNEIKLLLKQYLGPMLEKNIDCLVLGCTHYPYLIPVLKELLPPNVQIIDSGEAVARQTKKILEEKKLLNKKDRIAKHQWFTTLCPKTLELFAPKNVIVNQTVL